MEDEGVHTFPKGICAKVNIIAQLEYKLAYYDSAVHRFNHDTMRTPPPERLGKYIYIFIYTHTFMLLCDIYFLYFYMLYVIYIKIKFYTNYCVFFITDIGFSRKRFIEFWFVNVAQMKRNPRCNFNMKIPNQDKEYCQIQQKWCFKESSFENFHCKEFL